VQSLLPATLAVAQPVLATPPKHILVPIDFSTQSTRALKSAVQLARRYAATVTLIHVVEPIFYTHDFGYGPVRRQRPHEGLIRHARQRLHALRRRHVDAALACNLMIKSGSAFDQIVKAAEALGADLIVMPTRGFTHRQPDEIGSTAERVVRHAPCPVLTVRKPVLLGKRSQS
jgi:nucleotide-binding universal stress UspA family protein